MCNRDLLVGGASNDGAFRGVSSADSDLGVILIETTACQNGRCDELPPPAVVHVLGDRRTKERTDGHRHHAKPRFC